MRYMMMDNKRKRGHTERWMELTDQCSIWVRRRLRSLSVCGAINQCLSATDEMKDTYDHECITSEIEITPEATVRHRRGDGEMKTHVYNRPTGKANI